jgi:hypothetical protein
MNQKFKELWLSILNKNFAETEDKKEALLKTFRELGERSEEWYASLSLENNND